MAERPRRYSEIGSSPTKFGETGALSGGRSRAKSTVDSPSNRVRFTDAVERTPSTTFDSTARPRSSSLKKPSFTSASRGGVDPPPAFEEVHILAQSQPQHVSPAPHSIGGEYNPESAAAQYLSASAAGTLRSVHQADFMDQPDVADADAVLHRQGSDVTSLRVTKTTKPDEDSLSNLDLNLSGTLMSSSMEGRGDGGRDYTHLFGGKLNTTEAKEKPKTDVLGDDLSMRPTERTLPVITRINLTKGLNSKFQNLNSRVVFFRPKVFRKSTSGNYVERVLFIVPTGVLHLCDRTAVPKRSVAIKAIQSFAVHETRIAILFDSQKTHDLQLRFDVEEGLNLPSLKQFISLIRHFNPDASYEKGIVGGLSKLDMNLAKPAGFTAPGRIGVLSVPQGQPVPGQTQSHLAASSDVRSASDSTQANPMRARTSFLLPTEDDVSNAEDPYEYGSSSESELDSSIYQPKDQKQEKPTFRAMYSSQEDAVLRQIVERETSETPEAALRNHLGGTMQGSSNEPSRLASIVPSANLSRRQSDLVPSSPINTNGSFPFDQPPPSLGSTMHPVPSSTAATDTMAPRWNHHLDPMSSSQHLSQQAAQMSSPVSHPRHAENEMLFKAQQAIKESNDQLSEELKEIDAAIAKMQKHFGDTSAMHPSSSVNGTDVSLTRRVASHGYNRALVLSTLICEICRRKRMNEMDMPPRELLLPSRGNAKKVIHFI